MTSTTRKSIDTNLLIVLVAAFVLVFANFRILSNFTAEYALSPSSVVFMASACLVLLCFDVILLGVSTVGILTKPVLILFLMLSAGAAYFMDTYNVIIDDVMIDNILQTDSAEVSNLISTKQLLYILLLGVAPSYLVYRTKIAKTTWRKGIARRLGLITGSILLITATLFTFSSAYATFFREHKLLRFYTNPTYLVYSIGLFAKERTSGLTNIEFTQIGLDAHATPSSDKRKLLVVVVGETVRADHLALNGYERDTNPLLETENVISFSNVWSCGTSTSVSVPCMFSPFTRDEYSASKGANTGNVLDMVQRAGSNVLWLDNNSDSKGVALRVPYISTRTSDFNDKCDSECRDEGMIDILNEYVPDHPDGDIVIVMHQMGNHGPAYYKRYPRAFEQFTPACQTNILENCTQEEIINSYDNALLYTDFFLANTIEALKAFSTEFSTSMFYISDHGESLGEHGLYLHGLPYALAPDTQKRVPMMMWFDETSKAKNPHFEKLYAKTDNAYSHAASCD